MPISALPFVRARSPFFRSTFLAVVGRGVANGQETAEEAGVPGGDAHLRLHLHLPADCRAQCGVHRLLDRGLVRPVHQGHHLHVRRVVGKRKCAFSRVPRRLIELLYR